MSGEALTLPEIGSKWTHLTEPGVFVVTDGTLNGQVIWAEEGRGEEYYAPVREFRMVFKPVEIVEGIPTHDLDYDDHEGMLA